MLLVVLLREKENPLELSRLGIQPKLLGRILAIGVPAGLQLVMFDLSNTLIQSGINSFGSTVMASWTAYTKTDALTWMVSGAFGVAITTFVGQNYGAHRYDRVRQSVRVCLAMSIGTVGVISLLMTVFRRVILGVYTTDTSVIETGAFLSSCPLRPRSCQWRSLRAPCGAWGTPCVLRPLSASVFAWCGCCGS